MIEELRNREEELKKTITDIRVFNNEQDEIQRQREENNHDESLIGHNVLGKNKRILVLGDSVIDMKDMYGIAKTFGFCKKDIEYYLDYEKITNAAGRLQNSKNYDAIILGAMPHKVSNLGCWNSIASKFETEGFGPFCVEATNNSGKLVLNKESFKKALASVIEELKNSK